MATHKSQWLFCVLCNIVFRRYKCCKAHSWCTSYFSFELFGYILISTVCPLSAVICAPYTVCLSNKDHFFRALRYILPRPRAYTAAVYRWQIIRINKFESLSTSITSFWKTLSLIRPEAALVIGNFHRKQIRLKLKAYLLHIQVLVTYRYMYMNGGLW